MNYFEKIIGYETVKKELERIIDCLNNKEKYESFGVKLPKGLLISGEPGLGKTTIAECFVKSLNRRKYIIKKDRANMEFSNYLSNRIKDAIYNEPSVVFLDDIDKYNTRDSESGFSDNYAVIQSLIDDSKDKDVFFIMTTNNIKDLPDTLIRKGRVDYNICINTPNREECEKIVSYYLQNKNLDNNININEINNLLNGSSCVTLEKVLNEAGLISVYNNHDNITQEDLIESIIRVLYDSPVDNRERNDYQRKILSIHEAGHALVAELLAPQSVSLVTIKNCSGDTGGVTVHNRDDNIEYDGKLIENEIRIAFGGKAAIELVLNQIDIGCESDISKARRYGSSLFRLSLKGFPNPIDELFLPNTFNRDVDKLLLRYYEETKELIKNNMDKLQKIADYLCKNITMRQKDIRIIMDN